MSFGLFFSALALAVCLAGCDERSKSQVQYGEPVGIEIGAHGPVPALSVAVAATKGRDVSVTVSSLATAMYAAAAGCPAFLASVAAGSTTRLSFTAQGDALHAPPKVPEGEAAACMARALDGKPVKTDKPDALDVLVEIRAEAARP